MDAPRKLTRRTQTFADEWQVRDIPLAPSEVRTVKRAAEALGIPLSHTPTGRTTSLVLQQAMNLSLQKSAEAKNEQVKARWYGAYLRAKQALGRNLN